MNRTKGFTLVELLVTVAIVGILAAIAYPSYTANIQKTRREDAKATLMGLANALERHFTENSSYCDAGTTVAAGCGNAGTGDTAAPTIFSSVSPIDGGDVFYNLTINAVTATSYTIRATPAGVQVNDVCGTLTLDQTGTQGVIGQDAALTADDCWN